MKPTILFFALAAGVCALLTPPSASAQQRLRGHVPEAVARLHLQPLGRLPGTNHLRLTIVLPLRNRETLTNLLQQLYDPASTNYHRYLTPAQFAEKFGPTESDYQAVIAFAKRNGLQVTGTHPNRTLLDVRGSVADIEKSLHVRMNRYQHPAEKRTFFASDMEPSLDLSVPVLHVAGLDNFVKPRPLNYKIPPRNPGMARTKSGAGSAPSTGSGPGGEFMGNDFRAAYVPGVALTGRGQTVGLVELGAGFVQSDITAYESQAGLPNVPVTAVLIDGYDGSIGDGNTEVSLDIELAISMAPGLGQVRVYECPNDGSPIDDLLNKMASEGVAMQLSSSWGYPTDVGTEQVYQQFATQGQTFFNASGDGDAWLGPIPGACEDSNVTIVGGTTLTTTGPGGAWVSETVWNWGFVRPNDWNPDGYIGSSGGISTDVGLPSWQQGIDMSANHGSTTMRNVPDVALTADNIFVTYSNGLAGNFGGTSCAAPLWAGLIALANEQAVAFGRPTVGFLNPAVYALAQTNTIAFGGSSQVPLVNASFESPAGAPGTVAGTPDGWMAANLNPYGVYNPPPGVYTNEVDDVLPAPAQGSQVLWIQYDNYVAQFLTNTLAAGQSYTLSGAIGNRGDGYGIQSPSDQEYVYLLAGGTIIASNVNLPHPAPGGFLSWTISYTVPLTGFPTGSLEIRLGQVGGGQVQFDNIALVLGLQTPTYANCFHDIVTGDNTWDQSPTNYFAVPGYDLCTGWGTPTGQSLIDDLAPPDSLVSIPAGFTFIGNPGGPFTNASPSLILTNTGASLIAWSLANNSPWLDFSTNGGTLVAGGSATLVVSINPAANNLGPGDYTATIWFTNLDDLFAESVTFTLTVLGAPVILAQPQDQELIVGSSATFTISVTGATPLNYSWQQNGAPIPDATNATYTTANVQLSDFGSQFTCVVTNSVGAITSSVASLIVFTPPCYSFNGVGSNPNAALVLGSDGNLYGTTEGGGYGAGIVFKLTTAGVLTTLVSFDISNGDTPSAGLVLATDGNFYGTTEFGGVYGDGTVFRMTTNGALTTLVSFGGTNNGSVPFAGLVQGSDGNFYGTTVYGGAGYDGSQRSGYGTVFRMTPDGALTTLVMFNNTNGAGPLSALVQGSDGNFYGTTENGTSNGTVFRMTTNGVLTILVAFNVGNGAAPFAGLIQGKEDGCFYGTTALGGAYNSGTAFRMTTNGLLTTLVSFNGTNGAQPQAALVQGSDGNFYGTTSSGGSYGRDLGLLGAGDGTVFSMAGDGTLHTLLSFAGVNGFRPAAAVMQGSDGNLYGTTFYGGDGFDPSEEFSGNGIVFRVVLPDSLPAIVTQPLDQAVNPGGSAAFNVTATSGSPLSYQWQFLGTNISGAVSSNYTVANVTAADVGGYDVIVTNDYGSATSRVAQLTLVPPVGTITYGGQPVAFFPTSTLTNHVLQYSTDPAGGNWFPVTGGNSFSGMQINVDPGAAFFRLGIGADPAIKVAAGHWHSLFLKGDGSLWGMGYNVDGELGNGGPYGTGFFFENIYAYCSVHPVEIVTNGVTAIAAGGYHSLFLKSDGSLWGMGLNSSGELGDGSYNHTNWPEQIMASNVTAIAAGNSHSLFLKCDGSLWAMGDNTYGQLGNGTNIGTNLPVQIQAGNVTAIAAGYFHSLFLKSDGSLWAMGQNQYGQLGDGSNSNAYCPERVASNVTAIAAGGGHTLFLKQDGSLWAMGEDLYGQLGDSNYDTVPPFGTNQPEQIVASNVVAIAAGGSHSLFIKSNGSLWGMGFDYYGQLGDSVTYPFPPYGNPPNGTNQPEEILASNVTAIAAGDIHSVFIKSDGSAWAMGNEYYGQLGQGTGDYVLDLQYINYEFLTPQPVVGVPALPMPQLALGNYENQPVILFPTVTTPFNYSPTITSWLLMATNLTSGDWVTVSNAIPFSGVQITNALHSVFFRLY